MKKKSIFYCLLLFFFLLSFLFMPRGMYLFSEKQNNRIIEKAHLSPAWYEQNPELLKKQIEKNIEIGRTHFLGNFDMGSNNL